MNQKNRPCTTTELCRRLTPRNRVVRNYRRMEWLKVVSYASCATTLIITTEGLILQLSFRITIAGWKNGQKMSENIL